MVHDKLSFSANRLALGDTVVETTYPIADALTLDNKVIVLYEPDAYTEKMGQFPNLVAFDQDGKQVWIAELPCNHSGERYHKIDVMEKLMGYTWGAYECEIDPATGKIIHKHHLR